MAAAQVELKHQLQNGTSLTLYNQTVASMHLIKAHSWAGHFHGPRQYGIIDSPPTTIPSNGPVVRFDHLRDAKGSKAAGVSYTIKNAAGAPLAVILAWNAPTNFNPSTSPNKVYAACGTKSLIDSMSWDLIERLLDNAESSVAVDKDGVFVEATTVYNPNTNMADLPAIFRLCRKP